MKRILKKHDHTEGVNFLTKQTQQTEQPSTSMKILKYEAPFALENGEILPEIQIAYHTYGTLNAVGDNVVWVCHALTGNSEAADWWSGLVGEGKYLDPTKYFIVCANMLGSHYGSTSPLSINPKTGRFYGLTFPTITIRDVVNGHKILAQHLGIQSINLAIGGSMGGQQVLEWAIMQPAFFKNIAVIACGAKMTPWSIALNETQRMAIEADPSVNAANIAQIEDLATLSKIGSKGMEAARAIGMLSYRSYEGYNFAQKDDRDLLDTFKVQSYQRYQGQKLAQRFNALSYISLSKTMDSHNVGRNRGGIEKALKNIRTNTLIVGIQSDILFPLEEQIELAKQIPNAKLEVIQSKFGHDGFLIEFDQMLALLQKFMER
ncbi:MAG: homoserine O-acetyltransferase [Saprospiraceae bacterium]|nr:homoserine O-acetyltransferase [Saprospiraceae bacterium]